MVQMVQMVQMVRIDIYCHLYTQTRGQVLRCRFFSELWELTHLEFSNFIFIFFVWIKEITSTKYGLCIKKIPLIPVAFRRQNRGRWERQNLCRLMLFQVSQKSQIRNGTSKLPVRERDPSEVREVRLALVRWNRPSFMLQPNSTMLFSKFGLLEKDWFSARTLALDNH